MFSPCYKCSVKHANKQPPVTLWPQQRNFVGNNHARRMNTELYNLVKKGATFTEDGERITVTNEEMAAFAWESHKRKMKKTPHRIAEYLLLKHKTAVTPYGSSRFTIVHKTRSKHLLADGGDWQTYTIATEPVGVEKAGKAEPKAKTAKDGNV